VNQQDVGVGFMDIGQLVHDRADPVYSTSSSTDRRVVSQKLRIEYWLKRYDQMQGRTGPPGSLALGPRGPVGLPARWAATSNVDVVQ